MRHDAHPRLNHRRARLTALLACAALVVPAAAAPDAGAAKARSKPVRIATVSTTATVPSCAGLTWASCSRKLRRRGFSNFERAIDPYDNCGCGAAGVWRIIDDRGERIEGLTIAKSAHFLVQTNPD